jgi:hypothetical protein
MILVSITPGPEAFDLRTFECKTCDHSYTAAIARDPMNAVSAGWVASELRTPS